MLNAENNRYYVDFAYAYDVDSHQRLQFSSVIFSRPPGIASKVYIRYEEVDNGNGLINKIFFRCEYCNAVYIRELLAHILTIVPLVFLNDNSKLSIRYDDNLDDPLLIHNKTEELLEHMLNSILKTPLGQFKLDVYETLFLDYVQNPTFWSRKAPDYYDMYIRPMFIPYTDVEWIVIERAIIDLTNQEYDRLNDSNEEEALKDECCICLSAESEMMFLPCKHQCVCGGCCAIMNGKTQAWMKFCPLCRTEIHTAIKVEIIKNNQ